MATLEGEDRAHAEGLLRTYEGHLKIRENQKAIFGDAAEPYIELDIQKLRVNIASLNEMLAPPPSDAVQRLVDKHLEDNQRFLFVQAVKTNIRLATVEETVATVVDRVERIDAAQHAAGLWRLAKGEIIDRLQQWVADEDQTAKRGRKRNFVLLLVVVGGMPVLFCAVAWLIYVVTVYVR